MGFKSILLAAIALVLSNNINAALVDNGSYTTDSVNGLDWLDLTETTNRNYNDISSQLGVGGEFEGWRYATQQEVSGFFDAFGGDNAYYDGWSTQNNGLFDAISLYWGDTYAPLENLSIGEGYSLFITAESSSAGWQKYGNIHDYVLDVTTITQDFVDIDYSSFHETASYLDAGHALVRDVSAVPVPAAVWLFGSGLLGLVGLARRKQSV